jgi:hypothetical protein
MVQASATLVVLTAAGLLAGLAGVLARILRLLAGLLAAALLMLAGLVLAALLLLVALLAGIIGVLIHHVLSCCPCPTMKEDREAKVPITTVSTPPTYVDDGPAAMRRCCRSVTDS